MSELEPELAQPDDEGERAETNSLELDTPPTGTTPIDIPPPPDRPDAPPEMTWEEYLEWLRSQVPDEDEGPPAPDPDPGPPPVDPDL